MIRSADLGGGKIITILWWSLLAIVLALVFILRVRLLSYPLERDEGEYAYAGQLMLEGISPYKLAYNMKFPGTYAAYALIMAIGGQTTVAIHVGLLVVNLATVALVFFLARQLYASTRGAIGAAAAYAILSVSPDVYGFSAHATQFIAFVITGASLLLLRVIERKSLPLVLVTGATFGLAVVMKQPAIIFVAFGAGYLLFADFRRHLALNRVIARNLVFLVGAAIPIMATMLFLWRTGVFDRFWFWTIRYAAEYGSLVPFLTGLQLLKRQLDTIVPPHAALLLLAAIALVATLWKDASERKVFIGGLTAASLAALSAGLYFRPHYFVLVLPAIAILVGAVIAYVDRVLSNRLIAIHIGALVAFAGTLGWPIIANRDLLWQLPPDIVSKFIYSDAPFPESVVIADYIREHSAPDDTVAVIGSEPEIYFLSHRHSATGYIYTYALMEPQKFSQTMQREMIQEIEAARPKYLVNVALATSWNAQPKSDLSILTWVDNYVAKYYSEVGLVNFGEHETQYHFEKPIPEAWPTCIILYERNATAARGQ